jgi:hypothetical protein
MASYTVACLNRNVACVLTYLKLRRRGHITYLDLSVELVMSMYLQSIMVCTFGLYVWAKAASFGSQPECNANTIFLFFGRSHSAAGAGRSIALGMITLSARHCLMTVSIPSQVSLGMFAAPTVLFPFPFVLVETLVIPGRFCHLYRPSVYTIFLSGWLYIVVTVEITIRRNSVLHGSVEWTFGQVSPVVLRILNSIHNIEEIDLPTC